MVTIIFVGVIGVLIVGFVLWVLAFGGMKRRGQSPQTDVNAQEMNSTKKRSS